VLGGIFLVLAVLLAIGYFHGQGDGHRGTGTTPGIITSAAWVPGAD
jgi:hypothetical protein